jgi:hypothetical protein
MHKHLVFLDTEFTNWSTPRLISIGLVDLSGERNFYAELTDTYMATHCSTFVRERVLPLLTGAEAQLTSRECRDALVAWFAGFGGPVEIVSDCLEYDFYVLLDLLGHDWPANLPQVGLQFDARNDRAIQPNLVDARLHYYRGNSAQQKHHALHDALAMRASWLQASTLGGRTRTRILIGRLLVTDPFRL